MRSVCAPAHLTQAANRHHLRAACVYKHGASLQSLSDLLPDRLSVVFTVIFLGFGEFQCPNLYLSLEETLLKVYNLHFLHCDSAFAL